MQALLPFSFFLGLLFVSIILLFTPSFIWFPIVKNRQQILSQWITTFVKQSYANRN